MCQQSLLETPSAQGLESPASSEIRLLPAADVRETLGRLEREGQTFTTTILDPWYNRGVGGVRDDYEDWLFEVVEAAAGLSHHVFVWGFPDVVAFLVRRIPSGLTFVDWITWYYKNCPSVIRGWRSAQNACLHFARPNSKMYVEHFLSPSQERLRDAGKLRYMPGPANVLEVPLNVGFVGRSERTGHPSQKPAKTFEPLVLMTTKPGDSVLDPMCGSGTTGEVCRGLGRNATLCDVSEEYLEQARARLFPEVSTECQSTRAGTRTLRASLSPKRPGRSRKG